MAGAASASVSLLKVYRLTGSHRESPVHYRPSVIFAAREARFELHCIIVHCTTLSLRNPLTELPFHFTILSLIIPITEQSYH